MRVRRCKIVMNPQGLKPVGKITDRAKRYRANRKENRPGPPKQCGFCGSRRNVGIDHISGNESDGDRQNLMWLCKRCNTDKGIAMKRAGLGKLTRQFNPRARGSGSRKAQMKAYGDAIKVMRGKFEGDVGAAMATIRRTSAELRSAYTSRTWPVRKQIYGPSGRQEKFSFGEVPF